MRKLIKIVCKGTISLSLIILLCSVTILPLCGQCADSASYQDPYGDVVNTGTFEKTAEKPYIDIKECYIWNNNTTLFIKYFMWDEIKERDGVKYICFFCSQEKVSSGFYNTKGACYENGKADFWGHPIKAYPDGSSLLFEVPIRYLNEEKCIFFDHKEGPLVNFWPYIEELSDECYIDTMGGGYFALQGNVTYDLLKNRSITRIRRPRTGDRVSGMVNISYDAYCGERLIKRIEIEIYPAEAHDEGGTPILYTNSSKVSSYYLWDSTTVPDCWYKILIGAFDGIEYSLPDITEVYVNNNQMPTIEIVSPSTDQKVKGDVAILYRATAAKGNITEVSLKIDDGPWKSILSASIRLETDYCTYSWDSTTVNNGWHTIYMRAVDDGGNHSNIASVRVYVDNDELWQLLKSNILVWASVVACGVVISLILVRRKIKWKQKK